jgi:hypothetical protein
METSLIVHLKNLRRDEEFIDYCIREIHDIIKGGYVDKQSIASIIKIITYIIEKESKHQIPIQIFSDVLEAFVIDILGKYGIKISPAQYEHIVDEIKDIIRNVTDNRVTITQ